MSAVAVQDAPAGSGAHRWIRTTGGFGVIVFLASDVMLFAPFFAASFVLRDASGAWPPADVELDTARAAAATVALVASSVTLVLADRALARTATVVARRWQLVTIALGVAFLLNQLDEYRSLEFAADSHPYGSVFFLLTGLHSAHVLAGVFAILMLFVRTARAADLGAVDAMAAGVSAYWHMVDVVWIGVFVTIWLVR